MPTGRVGSASPLYPLWMIQHDSQTNNCTRDYCRELMMAHHPILTPSPVLQSHPDPDTDTDTDTDRGRDPLAPLYHIQQFVARFLSLFSFLSFFLSAHFMHTEYLLSFFPYPHIPSANPLMQCKCEPAMRGLVLRGEVSQPRGKAGTDRRMALDWH